MYLIKNSLTHEFYKSPYDNKVAIFPSMETAIYVKGRLLQEHRIKGKITPFNLEIWILELKATGF